jgi:hypothetical protein
MLLIYQNVSFFISNVLLYITNYKRKLFFINHLDHFYFM